MIKLFEEFSVTNDSLYWVITEDEFYLETDSFKTILPFSEKEISKIREFNLRTLRQDIEVRRKMFTVPHIRMGDLYCREYGKLCIYKSDDDYYYVIQRNENGLVFYKCDEMDGLFNFIVDLSKHPKLYNYIGRFI